MSDIQIALDYIAETRAKLAEGASNAILVNAVGEVLNNLWRGVAQYPEATEANQPGRISIKTHKPMGYYERGRGWWYPIMRKEALGEKQTKARGAINAPRFIKQTSQVMGYKLAGGGKSEALGRHWTMQVNASPTRIAGVLMNSASYAAYVQGDLQNRLHAARGWQTINQVVEQQRADIQTTMQQAVIDFLIMKE
jgi:hypothetical protein